MSPCLRNAMFKIVYLDFVYPYFILYENTTTKDSYYLKWIIHFAPKDSEAKDFIINYNASIFDVSIEKIKLENMEDKGILQKWGDTIHRINLKEKEVKPFGKQSFIIRPKA